jgi:hypothetical protein
MQTLYPNDQTRNTVIKAYQDGTSVIGWILNGNGSGAVFNPSLPFDDQLALVVDVTNTLIAIAASSTFLIKGNTGIAVTDGIYQSTHAGMLADDFVTSGLLQGVTFVHDYEVH